MERVAIGMSGGVDSSVAAAVLKEQGYEVIGITMHLFDHSEETEKAAKTVADFLGIEHHILDARDLFEKQVMDYFATEYVCGRTPNPCIACNRFLKFDAMLSAAKAWGCEKIATGHYARIVYDGEKKRHLLYRGCAEEKDQTYVLYHLTQHQLSHILMPLGDFPNKEAVREKARALNLPCAQSKESMEICFVPDDDYVAFLKNRLGTLPPKGNFVNQEGQVLGEHQGIVNYTIGQRKGLGIAFGKPMFVTRIDAQTNQVVLGEKGSEFQEGLRAKEASFIPFDALTEPLRAHIKVRYSAKPALGTVYPEEDGVRVVFDAPQRAITPGQAVVFYEPDGDMVLGGAIIEE